MSTHSVPTSAVSPAADEPLLDLPEILPAVFGPKHPSPRWFEGQVKKGIIPAYKIGRLVRYSPRRVREALDRNCLIEAKANRSARKTEGRS